MNPIEVREITGLDVVGFHACLDDVAREHAFLALEQAPPLAETRAFVEAAIARGDIRVIAEGGDVVVGWCDITRHRFPSMQHVGQLGMGVRKAFRRQGIGRRLLARALELAADASLEKVELDVFSSNTPAIQLYLSSGFREEGVRRRARKVGDAYEDIIQLGYFLNVRS